MSSSLTAAWLQFTFSHWSLNAKHIPESLLQRVCYLCAYLRVHADVYARRSMYVS